MSSVTELYKKQNILNTLDLLNRIQIDFLVLKGSALAYSHYKQPYLRVRGDTDVLIRYRDKEAVDTLLIDNGYQKSNTVSGKLISHQNTYSMTDNGINHNYDIHWKLSNRNAFAHRFEFDELYGRREPVAGLAGNVYRLCNTDALLHAIIHYYGHFPVDRDRLIWIYDMHLLGSQIKPPEWADFLKHCAAKKLDPLAVGALSMSQTTFDTQLPGDVLQTLEQSPVKLNKIEQQRLTASSWSRLEQFKSDWAALSFTQRSRLIREYLRDSDLSRVRGVDVAQGNRSRVSRESRTGIVSAGGARLRSLSRDHSASLR